MSGPHVPLAALPDREAALARATEGPLDLIVVGGGITGAGVALDAVTRGYRVALVERDDIASGTSSKSSKLVHGGLRYLANGDVAMVAEGIRERDRTRRNAPHLVRPLPFVVADPSFIDRALLKVGLLAYDAMGTGRAVAPHRRLDRGGVRTAAPTLRAGGGGYRYWDARTDDARLTMAIVQAARLHGALVINHCEATKLVVSSAGRVERVDVRDTLTDETASLSARWVVAAAGVWAGDARALAPAGSWEPAVTPARGAHLVFDRAALPVSEAVIFGSADGDGRRLFAIPWGGQVYVGTNDVPGGDMTPTVTRGDASYMLDAIQASFHDAPSLGDAVGAWAGLRPLVGDASSTADISRKHLVVEDPAGLVSVTGGKLTTWRQMAEDVVDRVVDGDGGDARCLTSNISLGAVGDRRAGDTRTRAVGSPLGFGPVASSALYHRHGDLAPAVMAACVAEEDGTEPLVPGLPYLRGEVRWAVRHELARTVDDVLQRRTRVSLRHRAAGGAEAIAYVARVLDEELGVDAQAQTADYLARVDTERGPVTR
jgi:glycerol-3-phosphate dehydrogenase